MVDVAVVLGLAALGGMVAMLFRQPVILGYIGAGSVVSALGWGSLPLVEVLGQLGVTLLLFLVGLELPLVRLKKIGKVALATGLGQIGLTLVAGWWLASSLGFSPVAAGYLAAALTFSSTIIAVKLLLKKGDLDSLYGQIAVGFLLVQDFVAIGILVVLSATGLNWTSIAGLMVKGVGLVVVAVWLAQRVFPPLVAILAKSTELLFIASLGWCLVVAAVVASPVVGLSWEIGGFLAGLALANAAQSLAIGARVRPLQDFFLTWFFVALGASVNVGQVGQLLAPAAILSLFVLLGHPLVVLAMMGFLGYKRRTSFLTGVTVAQISEFSLILVALGVRLGHIDKSILALTTMVGITTMTISTYLTLNVDKIFRLLSKWLVVFERQSARQEKEGKQQLSGHVVLIGHNRTGGALRPALEKLSRPLVVVDFNPAIVEKLQSEGVNTIFGDISDPEIYASVGLAEADLVVSTVSDVNDNLRLLAQLPVPGSAGKRPLVVVTATDTAEAKQLYRVGADYVLVPHAVGGEYLAQIFDHHGLDRAYLAKKSREMISETTKPK